MTKNIKYDMHRILTNNDKCISEVRGIGGILAKLWRSILRDINMEPIRFEFLLSEFISKTKTNSPENRLAKFFTRGNLRRELEKTQMTFKVFMKGIKMLRVTHMRISLELTYSNNKKSITAASFDLGDCHDTSELEEMEKEQDE